MTANNHLQLLKLKLNTIKVALVLLSIFSVLSSNMWVMDHTGQSRYRILPLSRVVLLDSTGLDVSKIAYLRILSLCIYVYVFL